MPELRTEKTLLVDCHDLDIFVAKVYGRPYSSLEGGEYSNGSVEIVDVEFPFFNDNEQSRLMKAWETDGVMPPVDIVLVDLFDKLLIPEGTYAVRMWW